MISSTRLVALFLAFLNARQNEEACRCGTQYKGGDCEQSGCTRAGLVLWCAHDFTRWPVISLFQTNHARLRV